MVVRDADKLMSNFEYDDFDGKGVNDDEDSGNGFGLDGNGFNEDGGDDDSNDNTSECEEQRLSRRKEHTDETENFVSTKSKCYTDEDEGGGGGGGGAS